MSSEAPTAREAAYAEAMFLIAKAEGSHGEVGDELYRVARALEANDELRNALSDPHIEAARRQQIVEDLLGGKASSTTIGLVSMVVATGRAGILPGIVDSLVEASAKEANKALAEVRSAVPLTEDQRARLAVALGQATGKEVDVKVTVDPTIQGGIIAQVGDTVIDGSVRRRLDQLKNAL